MATSYVKQQMEILKLLIPAIENIDSGCNVCIERFVEAANEAVSPFGFTFTFDYENYDTKINVSYRENKDNETE